MDPKQTLNDALAALDSGDYKAARWSLNYYRDWRAKGGFEPTWPDGQRGDRVALDIQQRINARVSRRFPT